MKTGENWKCPYCGHAQVVDEARHRIVNEKVYVQNWVEGLPAYQVEALVCANTDCRKMSLSFCLYRRKDVPGTSQIQNIGMHQIWRLLPASFAKPLPEYIPVPLRKDYEEACAIRDLSPKASATLIRRCIQGIIRDFCKIQKGTLKGEIDELRKRVDECKAPLGVQHDTVEAIDHVRGIGNIGAHMEKDINIIVDVDADEAQILIELAELLFVEWYVAREERRKRIQKLDAIAAQKKELQQQKQLSASAESSATTA